MMFLSNLIIKVFSILPLRLRIFIGRTGGIITSLFLKRDKKFIRLQSKIFLGKELSPIKIFANIGQSFLEAFNLKSIKDENIKITYNEENIIQEMVEAKVPQILLTGHLGNWELLAAYLIRHGVKMATAAKVIKIGLGQSLISKVRKNYGIKSILRGGNSGAKKILEEITSKHLTATLIDQHTNATSLESIFFNYSVKVPFSLIKVAKKHKANIYVGFMLRNSLANYQLFLHKIDSSKKISSIIEDFNKILEHYIRLYPEQWVWFHKRWRYINGKDLSRKEYLSYLKNLLKEQEKNVH